MAAILCAVLSGALLYASTGVNVALWPLAWLAPIPVLWLAYGPTRAWRVFLAAFAAMLAALSNIIATYLPVGFNPALVIALVAYALAFAGVVMLSRLAVRRLPPFAAAFAFPCLWTAWEWVVSNTTPDGTFGSWAYSQVANPLMIQSAALFGPWAITFLICAVASAVALALHTRRRARLALGGLAAVLFAGNLAWGLVRLADKPAGTVSVAVAASGGLDRAAFGGDLASALQVNTAYAQTVRSLAAKGAEVVVLPEKLAALRPAWAAQALAPLQAAADETGAVVVAGFDERGRARINRAIVLARGNEPWTYAKRRLVPGLERKFKAGDQPGLFAPGVAVAICKDMDFPQMLRADAKQRVGVLLVPAWDFVRDGRTHASMAILRGVEGGYSVVRSARNGWVSVSDDRGRLLAQRSTSESGMVTAAARISPQARPTLYLRIGDAFAWAAALAGALIIAAALMRRPRRAEPLPVH